MCVGVCWRMMPADRTGNQWQAILPAQGRTASAATSHAAQLYREHEKLVSTLVSGMLCALPCQTRVCGHTAQAEWPLVARAAPASDCPRGSVDGPTREEGASQGYSAETTRLDVLHPFVRRCVHS